MTDTQIAFSILGGYFIIWILLFAIVRRRFRKTLKTINDAHKAEQTTLLDDDDIRWQELGIQYSEFPYVELH